MYNWISCSSSGLLPCLPELLDINNVGLNRLFELSETLITYDVIRSGIAAEKVCGNSAKDLVDYV